MKVFITNVIEITSLSLIQIVCFPPLSEINVVEKKGSKIILGQKKFGPKTIWGEKKCWDQKKLGGWKKICVKKIMDPNFLDPKFFTIYQIGRLISIVSKPIQRYWV